MHMRRPRGVVLGLRVGSLPGGRAAGLDDLLVLVKGDEAIVVGVGPRDHLVHLCVDLGPKGRLEGIE